jgi:ABC-type nitrate/sulfonate/bicarbonate transport system substrate-binding protein
MHWIAAAFAVVLSMASSAVRAADDVALRLDFYAHAAHPALAYGIEKGIYAKHGINLKLLEGTALDPLPS